MSSPQGPHNQPAPWCDVDSMEITTDPARWPFCEARARERAALVAYPDPPGVENATRRRNAGPRISGREWAERRRHLQRVGVSA